MAYPSEPTWEAPGDGPLRRAPTWGGGGGGARRRPPRPSSGMSLASLVGIGADVGLAGQGVSGWTGQPDVIPEPYIPFMKCIPPPPPHRREPTFHVVEPLIHPGIRPLSEGAGVRRCGAPLPVCGGGKLVRQSSVGFV
jgi:hypothetical protein